MTAANRPCDRKPDCSCHSEQTDNNEMTKRPAGNIQNNGQRQKIHSAAGNGDRREPGRLPANGFIDPERNRRNSQQRITLPQFGTKGGRAHRV